MYLLRDLSMTMLDVGLVWTMRVLLFMIASASVDSLQRAAATAYKSPSIHTEISNIAVPATTLHAAHCSDIQAAAANNRNRNERADQASNRHWISPNQQPQNSLKARARGRTPSNRRSSGDGDLDRGLGGAGHVVCQCTRVLDL